MHKPGTLLKFKPEGLFDYSYDFRAVYQGQICEILTCDCPFIHDTQIHNDTDAQCLEIWAHQLGRSAWFLCSRFDIIFEPQD